MGQTEKMNLIHEYIIEILREQKQPISSKEISQLLTIPDAEAQPITRALILETMKKTKVPIGASSKGYFIIKSEEQLMRYVVSLQNRADKITDRKRLVLKYYYSSKKEKRSKRTK